MGQKFSEFSEFDVYRYVKFDGCFVCSWQAPEFDQNQIRLLVFNECDVKGRKLLFDSKAIKKKGQKLEVRHYAPQKISQWCGKNVLKLNFF